MLFLLFYPGCHRFFLKCGWVLRNRPQADTTAARGISGEASSAGVLIAAGKHACNVSCTQGRLYSSSPAVNASPYLVAAVHY